MTSFRNERYDSEVKTSRTLLTRWALAYSALSTPAAAAPILFAFIAIPLTGSADDGAAVVFAMTLAQVLGTVPVSRLGARRNPVRYLRLLVLIRTLALMLVAALAALQMPLWALAAAAAVAGLVNGAAYGYLRLILNRLVEPEKLPRAIGIAMTFNEVTFAVSPVVASLLGSYSAVLAMVLLGLVGAAPMLLIPRLSEQAADGEPEERSRAAARLLSPAVALWLFCTLAGATVVAVVEVGAVSVALSFELEPVMGAVFALVISAGAILGGIWVSVRNRMPRPRYAVLYLAATVIGAGIVAGAWSPFTTAVGAAIIGFFIPLLATFYSLVVDVLVPPERRAEAFALLRAASSTGFIVTSGVIALAGIGVAQFAALGFVIVAALLVTAYAFSTRGRAVGGDAGASAADTLEG